MCFRSINPAHFNRHYKLCSNISGQCITEAHKQQSDDLQEETQQLQDDIIDIIDQNSINNIQEQLIDDIPDNYTIRNKHSNIIESNQTLLRIEVLQYYDINKQTNNNNNNNNNVIQQYEE